MELKGLDVLVLIHFILRAHSDVSMNDYLVKKKLIDD